MEEICNKDCYSGIQSIEFTQSYRKNLERFSLRRLCVTPKRNLGNSIMLFVYVLHTGVDFITLTSVIFKRRYCFRVWGN